MATPNLRIKCRILGGSKGVYFLNSKTITMKKLILLLLLAGDLTALTLTQFTRCIEFVESSYNEKAYNASEEAVGCLQIRPVMLADYNRITGDCMVMADLWNRENSYKVAEAVFKHYMKYTDNPTAKHLAFIWNGGGNARKRVANPQDDQKQRNLERYWKKVKAQIDTLE